MCPDALGASPVGEARPGPAHTSAHDAEFCVMSRRVGLPAEVLPLAGSELGITLQHSGGSGKKDVTTSATGAGLKGDRPPGCGPPPLPRCPVQSVGWLPLCGLPPAHARAQSRR